MAKRPDIGWYKRYPDKALAGMFELNLEQRGAYNTIIDMIYARSGHLPDDIELLRDHFKCDIRVAKRLRDELVAKDKIQIVDGIIRTRKSDTEIDRRLDTIRAQSEGGSKGAEKRWNKGDEEDVGDLGDTSGKLPANLGTQVSDKSLGSPSEVSDKSSGSNKINGGKQPNQARVTHLQKNATRGGESEQDKEIDSTPSTESLKSATPKSTNPFDDDDNILNRVHELGKIAGLNLTRPEKIANALDQLREWLKEGMDYERDILPTIKARTIDNPSETVHSLRYFDAAVRKRFGLSSQGIAAPKPLTPPKPKDPIAAVDGPGDRVTEFRSRLTRTIGPRIYNNTFAPEHCAIEIEDDLVRLRFRSDAEATLAEARFGDGVSTAARAMSLAPTMGALK